MEFPRGFSRQEREKWIEIEERGAFLSLERLAAISSDDEEANARLAEATRKNNLMRQVLQDRIDELRAVEARRASRTSGTWEQPIPGHFRTSPIRDLLATASEIDEAPRPVTSEGVRTLRNAGKVPRDLPHFRGDAKNAIQDALEFIDRFETVCEPHGLEDDQFIRVLPICLDQVDGTWFKMWKSQNPQATWKDAKRAFMGHFRHHNELTLLQAQIRALRMDSTGVRRYADQFRKLMAQLGWNDTTEAAIFQFKQGLTRNLLDKLSGAEANLALVAGFTGQPEYTIGVDALISMVSRIEADRALNITGDSPKTATMTGKTEYAQDGVRRSEIRTCNYCRRIGHT
jgi:hypothetical protein